MQGFSYSQLYSALEVWPLKSSALYLSSLNRIIYLGELRVIIDLDLDIFDVNDQVTLAPGATTIPKPPGSQPITFTGGIAEAATNATLASAWTGTTGVYVVTFSDNEIQAVTLTKTQTTATWTLPMAAAVSANAVVNSQFIVERNLWVVYNGTPKALVKRSFDFIQMYLNAAAGKPYYFADEGQSEWLIAPAADAFATAVNRRYVQRPPSIVVAQNTWIGDNVGQLLFVACLMESEHWLKVDDRYADMKTKYYEELLPNARGEVMLAARSGVYAPLAPIASVPGPAPQAAAAG
jgi:hypothetical protein